MLYSQNIDRPMADSSLEVPPTFISMQKLSKRIDRAPSTIYRWSAEKMFPAAVKVGPRASAWRLAEVKEWEFDPQSWRDAHSESV